MLTLDDIEALVVSKAFYRFPDTTLTVCCATTEHGFHAVGKSACIDPAEFDEALGLKIAYEDALDKLWELEGYRVKCLAATP